MRERVSRLLRALVAVATVSGPWMSLPLSALQDRRSEFCANCQIQASKILTLGGTSEDGYVGSTLHLVGSDSLLFLSLLRESPYEIRVFSSDGAFRGTLGRRGQGPGEYKEIAALEMLAGDSLLVFDRGLQRFTLLGPDLSVVRTIPAHLSVHDRGIIETRRGWVVNGYSLTPGGIGHRLHLLDPKSGRVLEALDEERRATPDNTLGLGGRRWIAPSGVVGFWSLHMTSYRLERYDSSGLAAVIESPTRVGTSWFEVGPPPDRQGPQMLDVVEDSAGVVWVLGRTASTDWRETPIEVAPSVYPTLFTDFVLEAIDPSSGGVLATYRIPAFVAGFLSQDQFFTIRQTESLDPRIDIWRFQLSEALR